MTEPLELPESVERFTWHSGARFKASNEALRGAYVRVTDVPAIQAQAKIKILLEMAEELEKKAEIEEDSRGELWRIADAFRRAAESLRSRAAEEDLD